MLLSLPNVYQSFANQVHSFYCISHIVAIVTNYSNLLYQCFSNHYQSDPVLYIISLPMITNKLPIHLPIIALVISSPLAANVLTMALGNLPIAANGLQLVPIGNDRYTEILEDQMILRLSSSVKLIT